MSNSNRFSELKFLLFCGIQTKWRWVHYVYVLWRILNMIVWTSGILIYIYFFSFTSWCKNSQKMSLGTQMEIFIWILLIQLTRHDTAHRSPIYTTWLLSIIRKHVDMWMVTMSEYLTISLNKIMCCIIVFSYCWNAT